MAQSNKYLRDNLYDASNFNKYFQERINTDADKAKDQEKIYLKKINDGPELKAHQESIGQILFKSQSIFWELYDELKNGRKPFILLNPNNAFYVGILILIFGMLMLVLSTVFS
jgi:hypothetical protein